MIHYQLGISEHHRQAAVQLYEAAFGAKFAVAIPKIKKRQHLFLHTLDLSACIGAVATNSDKLVGFAGFSTSEKALTDGITPSAMYKYLGALGAMRALLILALYERPKKPNVLLMDGIAVNVNYQGQGIGSTLLDKIVAYASDHHYHSVRLDVINTNPRAQKLYARKGFIIEKVEHFSWLQPILGFASATTMIRTTNTQQS